MRCSVQRASERAREDGESGAFGTVCLRSASAPPVMIKYGGRIFCTLADCIHMASTYRTRGVFVMVKSVSCETANERPRERGFKQSEAFGTVQVVKAPPEISND